MVRMEACCLSWSTCGTELEAKPERNNEGHLMRAVCRLALPGVESGRPAQPRLAGWTRHCSALSVRAVCIRKWHLFEPARLPCPAHYALCRSIPFLSFVAAPPFS